MAASALRLMGSLRFMLSGQAVVKPSDARGARGAEGAQTGPEQWRGGGVKLARAKGTPSYWMMHHSTQQGSSGPQTPPAIAGALANSSLGPSDHTHRLRLAMAAPARIKGTCLSGRRRRRATLAGAPALAAVLLAAPCVGLVQNHALNHAAPSPRRGHARAPTRPCVKATATAPTFPRRTSSNSKRKS